MKGIDLKSLKENPGKIEDLKESIHPSSLNEVQKTVEKYQGKSEKELLAELLKATAREKDEGNLDDQKIDGILNMIAPMLGPQEQKRMEEIGKTLKSK